MNLNYAIFRSNPIYTLQDLAQIGSHNKREKQAYKSNPDIKLNMIQYNVELVPLAKKNMLKVFIILQRIIEKNTKKEWKQNEKIEKGSLIQC